LTLVATPLLIAYSATFPSLLRPGSVASRLDPAIDDTAIQRPSGEIATPSGVAGTEICWTARNGRLLTSTSVTTSASSTVLPTPVLPMIAPRPSLATSIAYG